MLKNFLYFKMYFFPLQLEVRSVYVGVIDLTFLSDYPLFIPILLVINNISSPQDTLFSIGSKVEKFCQHE